MIKLEMQNSSRILKQKKKKYQHYYQAKLININNLLVNKYYFLIKSKS